MMQCEGLLFIITLLVSIGAQEPAGVESIPEAKPGEPAAEIKDRPNEPPPPNKPVETLQKSTPSPGGAPAKEKTPAKQEAPSTNEIPAEEEIPVPPGISQKKIELRLSLQEAIEWALSKNLSLVAQEYDYDIRKRELIAARATFDPFFNMGTSYTKNRDPSVSILEVGDPTTGFTPTSFVTVSPTDVFDVRGGLQGLSPIGTSYQLSLIETRLNNPQARIFGLNPRYSTRAEIRATQPLLKGAWYSYNTANIRTALNNIELSREDLELLAINVVFNVENAYWDLVFAVKNYESKVKALQVARENLRIDKKKVEVGTKAKIDITTSESQVALRKTEYDQAASNLEDARDTLLDRINFVGVEESLKALLENRAPQKPFRKYSDILVIPSTEPSPESIQPDRSQSISMAFDNRVEYHKLDLQIKNQDIAIAMSQNELLPSLNITGAWSQLGLDRSFSDSVDRMFTGKFYDWSVGATFEVPLSLRGPRAGYRNARDLKRQLQLQKQELENTMVLEVDKAIRGLQYAHRAVLNLEKQVELQEELLRAEKVKLEVGKSISYTVALIENDLVAFEAQAIRAKADYEIAKTVYERAVGNLLKKRKVDLSR